jgi:hypothetical protein
MLYLYPKAPAVTRARRRRMGGDSRHFFASASAVCAIPLDATRDTSAAGVDSAQQVLTHPQKGVHIQQVRHPQPPPQPPQPQPKQRLKNAHLQCTPTPPAQCTRTPPQPQPRTPPAHATRAPPAQPTWAPAAHPPCPPQPPPWPHPHPPQPPP